MIYHGLLFSFLSQQRWSNVIEFESLLYDVNNGFSSCTVLRFWLIDAMAAKL